MDWKELKKSFIKKNLDSYEDNYPETVSNDPTSFDARYKYFLVHKRRYYSVKDVIRHSVIIWNAKNQNQKIDYNDSSRLIGGTVSNDGAGLFLENLGFKVISRHEVQALIDEDEVFGSIPAALRRATVNVRARSYKQAKKVLKKAKGKCQRCYSKATFLKKDNKTPYLEAHHIEELSKGGADHWTNMVALCPNCHRNIHHGKDGQKINDELARKLFN